MDGTALLGEYIVAVAGSAVAAALPPADAMSREISISTTAGELIEEGVREGGGCVKKGCSSAS